MTLALLTLTAVQVLRGTNSILFAAVIAVLFGVGVYQTGRMQYWAALSFQIIHVPAERAASMAEIHNPAAHQVGSSNRILREFASIRHGSRGWLIAVWVSVFVFAIVYVMTVTGVL